MASTAYPLQELDVKNLVSAASAATASLVRLDERIARSPIKDGLLQRFHFADACASLWVDGELVHLDDLVLHDAGQDNRAPSHELTIAKDVLRQRRRIVANPANWALSATGLNSLRGTRTAEDEPAPEIKAYAGTTTDELDELDTQLAAIDRLLNKSKTLLQEVKEELFSRSAEKQNLIYDLDWNEEDRLKEWLAVSSATEHLPAIVQSVILLDSWNRMQVLQHASWLGRQLAASALRKHHLATGQHLPALNIALKLVKREDRSARDLNLRLQNKMIGIQSMAEYGLKEHDKLLLARQMMSRHLTGRRSSSRLPQLIELVLSKPIISTEMVATSLRITQRASLRLIEELNLREVTGRGRFRAWGIL